MNHMFRCLDDSTYSRYVHRRGTNVLAIVYDVATRVFGSTPHCIVKDDQYFHVYYRGKYAGSLELRYTY